MMKKANVFIIHGAYGTPKENWFPWLEKEIQDLGFETFSPTFPTPENQSLDSWKAVFEPYIDKITEESIFIGHSLGPAFILNILEDLSVKVKACIFAAPFTGLLGLSEFDDINYSITDKAFNWDKIAKACRNFIIYHSDNDPYVNQKKSQFIADTLNASKYEIITNGGHLNKGAGFTSFPQILDDVKQILS